MNELVRVEIDGPVALFTLSDPARRNILTAEMVSQIADALDRVEADQRISALIVTGAGPAFCGGAELATLERAAAGDFGLIRSVYSGFLRVLRSPLLTIGAINGPAVGAGFNLALACDVRIASTSARFVSRFADLHVLPGGGHSWMLAHAVGQQAAAMAILLGKTWTGTEALQQGLVADCVDDRELLDTARRVAHSIDALEREYVRRAMDTLRQAPSISHQQALDIEAHHQEWSTHRESFLDGLERMRSAIQRRAPDRADNESKIPPVRRWHRVRPTGTRR